MKRAVVWELFLALAFLRRLFGPSHGKELCRHEPTIPLAFPVEPAAASAQVEVPSAKAVSAVPMCSTEVDDLRGPLSSTEAPSTDVNWLQILWHTGAEAWLPDAMHALALARAKYYYITASKVVLSDTAIHV